jgi:hypothetical protein
MFVPNKNSGVFVPFQACVIFAIMTIVPWCFHLGQASTRTEQAQTLANLVALSVSKKIFFLTLTPVRDLVEATAALEATSLQAAPLLLLRSSTRIPT